MHRPRKFDLHYETLGLVFFCTDKQTCNMPIVLHILCLLIVTNHSIACCLYCLSPFLSISYMPCICATYFVALLSPPFIAFLSDAVNDALPTYFLSCVVFPISLPVSYLFPCSVCCLTFLPFYCVALSDVTIDLPFLFPHVALPLLLPFLRISYFLALSAALLCLQYIDV